MISMTKDNHVPAIHHSMVDMIERMKHISDEDRFHLMIEWCEVLFNDDEDTLTIPQHFKIKEI